MENTLKKSLPLAALLGATGLGGLVSIADAAPVVATLAGFASYSNSGGEQWNLTADTSTWTFDTVTGTAVQTGGTFSALFKLGSNNLARHTMTGATLSSGAATGTTWACIEGTFGGPIGASICGNYNFGANLTNESTYTPSVTGASVVIGGDDGAIGPPQTLVNSYSGMRVLALAGAPVGYQWHCLTNSDTPFSPSGTFTNACGDRFGYTFLFQTELVPIPPAVWLFGSALGLMGVMRRKITS